MDRADETGALRAAEIMRERIVSGDWRSGRKLLSGDELALILRVDRHAVLAAISGLRQAGYLRTVPGKGVYVCAASRWPEY